MDRLEYTFKNDTLFKMLFVKYPHLLKRLTACLLKIPLESIGQFEIRNPEIPPDSLGEKFCRLDINMLVDRRLVDIEIQVYNEGDYRERSLYYGARNYSSALEAGGAYVQLPAVVIISIIDFRLFDSPSFYSEFYLMERTRGEVLTDKFKLCYFELIKVPSKFEGYTELLLWLKLFSAETEEDLRKLEAMEEPIMQEAINAYRAITVTSEFKELERLRSRARHNEASALLHARQEGEQKGREEGLREGEQKGRQEGLQEGELKGRQEGREEQALATARKLKAMNMSLEQIIQATGLTEPQIRDL